MNTLILESERLLAVKKLCQEQGIEFDLHTFLNNEVRTVFNNENENSTSFENIKIEETIMNPINLLLAKNEQFKFVSVVFDINRDILTQKQYTYKTLLDIQAGDLLIVPTQQGTFETVKAVSVSTEFVGDFELKWIAAKLDLEHLKTVKALEAEIKDLVLAEQKKKKAEKQTEMLEACIGSEGVSKAELIAKKVRI